MAEQSLRDALEHQLGILSTATLDNGYRTEVLPKAVLLDLLALHPTEPTPDRQPSDAAVEAGVRAAFERKYGIGWGVKWNDETRRARAEAEIRADVTPALVAAYRVDVPRPELDRGALSRRIEAIVDRSMETGVLSHNELVDAVMEMARPTPTREQIAEVINVRTLVEDELFGLTPGTVEHSRALAAAVLALMNGAGS